MSKSQGRGGGPDDAAYAAAPSDAVPGEAAAVCGASRATGYRVWTRYPQGAADVRSSPPAEGTSGSSPLIPALDQAEISHGAMIPEQEWCTTGSAPLRWMRFLADGAKGMCGSAPDPAEPAPVAASTAARTRRQGGSVTYQDLAIDRGCGRSRSTGRGGGLGRARLGLRRR